MRINIVTGPLYSLPPVGFGAVEKLWYDCGKYFASCGHEVTILARRGADEKSVEFVDGMQIKRYMHYTPSGNLKVNLLYDFLYSLRMTRLLPVADITVVNSFWLPFFAPWRKRVAGKIVYNVNRFPKGQLRLYKHTDRLSFVSQAVYDAGLRQCPSIKDRSGIIPNPINAEVFCDKGLDSHEGLRIIYAGRIAPEKGVDLLVRAFAEISSGYSDVKLELIGAWETKYGGGGSGYLASLQELGVGLPIEYTSPIREPEKLASAMRKGDIFVYPSCADSGESFGVAPLEAMAVGLPVIVSDLACFRDFIEDGKTGLVFNHRAKDASGLLANRLRVLLDNKGLRHSIGAAAVLAAKAFSVPVVSQMYLDDFQEIMKKM